MQSLQKAIETNHKFDYLQKYRQSTTSLVSAVWNELQTIFTKYIKIQLALQSFFELPVGCI